MTRVGSAPGGGHPEGATSADAERFVLKAIKKARSKSDKFKKPTETEKKLMIRFEHFCDNLFIYIIYIYYNSNFLLFGCLLCFQSLCSSSSQIR